jgi:long-chain acyl-CoA synthetase
MTDPKRLFDCIPYQLERNALPDMLAGKASGQWKKYSTAEVADTANQLSAGLLSMGIGPNDMTVEGRDKIAVLSGTSGMGDAGPAVQQIGALLTPSTHYQCK